MQNVGRMTFVGMAEGITRNTNEKSSQMEMAGKVKIKSRRRTNGFMNWFRDNKFEELVINEEASYEDMDPDKQTIEIRRYDFSTILIFTPFHAEN